MTITYSLWQGSQLLSVDNKANSADELLNVMTELNKLGKGFTYENEETEEEYFGIEIISLDELSDTELEEMEIM